MTLARRLSVPLLLLTMTACARSSGQGQGDDAGGGRDGGAADGSAITDAGPATDGASCATGSDQIAAAPVDIIIAIDQSASMGQERDGVAQNINQNLADILEASGLDYQVFLIHSLMCIDPPLGDPMDCLASNPPRLRRVLHGVNSSDALTIFLKSFLGEHKMANTCDFNYDANMEWGDELRQNALKVFIAVTDDDPYSFSAAALGCSNCPSHQCPSFADSPADWGGADFPTELYALPGNQFGSPARPNWIFHSIIGVDQVYQPTEPITPLNQVCISGGNTAETSGVEYQKLSVLTGGLRFPSCDTDYSPVFQEIANTIVPLACEFIVESTNLGNIDPTKTNVTFDRNDGTGPEVVLQDHSAPCDLGANGWQWNEDFTRILFCGLACDEIGNYPTGIVRITVGCETQVR